MSTTADWLHLRRFGYAPGNYMSQCLVCGETPIMDKLAVRCRPCAEAAYQGHLRSQGVPALLKDVQLVLDNPGIDASAKGPYNAERTRCHGCSAEADEWWNEASLEHEEGCLTAAAIEAEARLRILIAAAAEPQPTDGKP